MRRLVAAVLLGSVLATASGATDTPAQTGGPSAPSPYAGQQHGPVRGLSAEEVHALRTGEGRGLARPAELNNYPGPRHVLELADALDLSAEQRAAVAALVVQMQAEAVAAGERVLASYAALEQAFRDGTITAETLAVQTAELGQREGELRAVHLRYHLLTRALLTPEQVAAYTRLRGYAEGPAAPAGAGHGH
jgi:Spy/CpxP family protein refolding chaperone